jgi:hypothetical protein
MNEFLSEILKGLLAALVPVVGTVLVYATKKLIEYVESKTTNEYLKTFEHETGEVILAIEGEIVGQAKKDALDGKITQAELEQSFIFAKNKAIELLKLRLKNYPVNIAKIVQDKLSEVIESQIIKQKAGGAIDSLARQLPEIVQNPPQAQPSQAPSALRVQS